MLQTNNYVYLNASHLLLQWWLFFYVSGTYMAFSFCIKYS